MEFFVIVDLYSNTNEGDADISEDTDEHFRRYAVE